jgi:hypothetical protein
VSVLSAASGVGTVIPRLLYALAGRFSGLTTLDWLNSRMSTNRVTHFLDPASSPPGAVGHVV